VQLLKVHIYTCVQLSKLLYLIVTDAVIKFISVMADRISFEGSTLHGEKYLYLYEKQQ